MNNYSWLIQNPDPTLVSYLKNALTIPEPIAKCLVNRGIKSKTTAEQFLNPRLSNLSDPFLIHDIERAVDRILQARKAGEPVLIFGDYDVDGLTATAIIFDTLRLLKWNVDFYIPDRFDEGYGLSMKAIANCLKSKPCKVLLAVDCGSSSVDSVSFLKASGISVVILDHHQVSDKRPVPDAFVNPKILNKSDNNAIFAHGVELCSAGLAFKLVHALVKKGRQAKLPGFDDFDIREIMDLVALGTVADLVELKNDNRILVNYGMQRINKKPRPGLGSLIQVSRTNAPVSTYEIAFHLAPRLNAAGRLKTAYTAIELLLTNSPEISAKLANELDVLNRSRQQIEEDIYKQAYEMAEKSFSKDNDLVLVLHKKGWHVGVVGIVASKIVRDFYRPTIILSGDGEVYHGSGRSIEGFDLAAALENCKDLLIKHGGHSQAAGLAIHVKNIDTFRSAINKYAQMTITKDKLIPQLKIDAQIDLADLDLNFSDQIERFKPFGIGNPAPVFLIRNLSKIVKYRKLGQNGKHLCFWINNGLSKDLKVISWNWGEKPVPHGGNLSIVFEPQLNEYRGIKEIQLRLLDLVTEKGS